MEIENSDLYRWIGGVKHRSEYALVVRWVVESVDDALLNALSLTHKYEGIPMPLTMSRQLTALFSLERTVKYYKHFGDELLGDIELCLGVCPLFVLHGVAERLRGDADRGYAGRELVLLLHVLKHRLLDNGSDLGQFLRRLFLLVERVECPGGPKTRPSLFSEQYLRPHYLLVVTVFMTENLEFLSVKAADNNGKPSMCIFHINDVKQHASDAMQRLVESNLLYGMRCETMLCGRQLVQQMDQYCDKVETQWLLFYHGCSRRRGGKKELYTIELDCLSLSITDVDGSSHTIS
jgi:hypothetical protein